MGCKAPREGHCEACAMQDKSDTLGLCLGLCLSRSQRKQIPARRALPCILPVWAGSCNPAFLRRDWSRHALPPTKHDSGAAKPVEISAAAVILKNFSERYRIMKKKLAMLLCLVLLVTVLALPASADNSAAWDGSVDTSWYSKDATSFEVSTPAQLAGLAAIVNG